MNHKKSPQKKPTKLEIAKMIIEVIGVVASVISAIAELLK